MDQDHFNKTRKIKTENDGTSQGSSSVIQDHFNETREEFVRQQKKLIIKFILFLIIVIGVILAYQLMQYNQSSHKKEIQGIDDQTKELNQEIENLSISSNVTNVHSNETQINILNGIKKQLPQKIDPITTLQEAEFKDNVLVFQIIIDDRKLSAEDLAKFNSSKLNTLLLKNKPIACSLMRNIKNWDELWKIKYTYSLMQGEKEVGHATFSKGECH